MLNLYSVSLDALLQIKTRINIVVVGANDGRVNDPIYDFAMRHANRSWVCLIEPNTALLPYLHENYASHPGHKIANCAVGHDHTLSLYTIKEEFWEAFQPPYARGWPVYRAATGLTSASREHLEKALASHVTLNPDDVITTLNVPSKTLGTILAELNWPMPIDVLQIDAEGHDDTVIYASNLPSTRPKLIYFESYHLPSARLQRLLIDLSRHRYRIYTVDGNTLAIDSRISLPCLYLNGRAIGHLWSQALRKFWQRWRFR